uniref:Uncharacterized protein n=1 Tax=Cucumis melo TaxID=3656 RepID=A0A9I9EFV9_CUCME
MNGGTLRISTSSTRSRNPSPSNALRTSDLSSSVTSTTPFGFGVSSSSIWISTTFALLKTFAVSSVSPFVLRGK